MGQACTDALQPWIQGFRLTPAKGSGRCLGAQIPSVHRKVVEVFQAVERPLPTILPISRAPRDPQPDHS